MTPRVFFVGGFFGLLAAFELTLEKIAVTADPNYIPECDINYLPQQQVCIDGDPTLVPRQHDVF